jgi:chromosomal replication initiation ATPase DnaA
MSSMTVVSGNRENSRTEILFQTFREWNKNGTKESCQQLLSSASRSPAEGSGLKQP